MRVVVMAESVMRMRRWDLNEYVDGVLDDTIGSWESSFPDVVLPYTE